MRVDISRPMASGTKPRGWQRSVVLLSRYSTHSPSFSRVLLYSSGSVSWQLPYCLTLRKSIMSYRFYHDLFICFISNFVSHS